MMQRLLAERFALKVRRETKEAPAYALVLGRTDGLLGKQIAPSTVDCAALLRAQLAAGRGGPPTGPGGGPVCRLSSGGPGIVMARDVSIQQLAQLLSGQVQRQVVDETGLTGGSFDPSFATDQTSDPDRPSIFTAVQEQLGLKLESQRAPQEMLIVESVQRPTPD